MSFSDLMSSGRGPGVIGMVMALIVLLGFGLLFMFAFDEGFQGGDQSIESVIRYQQRDIDNSQEGIEKGRKTLGQAPARIAASKDLVRLKVQNAALQEKLSQLAVSLESAKATVGQSRAEFEAYKDKYRAVVRDKAKGTSMEVLETTTGVAYNRVNILEVTAVGLHIRHEAGQKRVPFEELPDSMKDYYQFDTAQRDEARRIEDENRKKHEAEVELANKNTDTILAIQEAKDEEAAREKRLRDIAAKQVEIASLENQLEDLGHDLDREVRKTTGVRNTGSIKGRMSAVKGKLNAARATLQSLQSKP